MPKTVVSLYDRFDQAQEVVQELVKAEVPRENISMVANDARGEHADRLKGAVAKDAEATATGAGMGAAAGGIAGLLLGLGALAVPGIGPVLAAGPIMAALSGAGLGAVAGGIIGSLREAGISEQDANIYSEGVRRGATLVTVYTSEEMANRVADMMNQHGPVDLQRRSEEWRQANWDTFDEGAEPYAFDRTRVENDRMRSATPSDVEGARSYGDLESGAVPRTNTGADVPGIPTGMRGFASVEPRFRQHFTQSYEPSGHGWGLYREAYRFGYDMAQHDRFVNGDWDVVKQDVRHEWEMRHRDQMWGDYEGAVYEAWLTSRESR